MRMGGGAKPFGVDADRFRRCSAMIAARRAEFRGFHVFAGTQNLSAEAIIDAQARTIDLRRRPRAARGAPLPSNIGGGFGIPYFPGDEPLDIARDRRGARRAFRRLAGDPAETPFCIELGRYLVGEAGVYLTRVIDRKTSHGEAFLVSTAASITSSPRAATSARWFAATIPSPIATRFGAPLQKKPRRRLSVHPARPTRRQGGLPPTEIGDIIAVFWPEPTALPPAPSPSSDTTSRVKFLVK